MSNEAKITVTTLVYDVNATPAVIGEMEYHHVCHIASDVIADIIRNGKDSVSRIMLNYMNYLAIAEGAKVTAYGDAQRGGIKYIIDHAGIKPNAHVTVKSENGKITLHADTDFYNYGVDTRVTIELL